MIPSTMKRLALFLALVAGCLPRARGAAFGLEDLWEDEVYEYLTQYTGDLQEEAGVVRINDDKLLLWEQPGWYMAKTLRNSAGTYKGKDYVDSGVGFRDDMPGKGTDPARLYTNALRRCGPQDERTPTREEGCSEDIFEGSPYGNFGDPGPGPQQWAYTGQSMGPPYVPMVSSKCHYSLSNKLDDEECHLEPQRGGHYVPINDNEGGPIGGPLGDHYIWLDRLPTEFQRPHEHVPLRWGFEEGQMYPYWRLVSHGIPNFAVRKHCFLDSHSGSYQLCSAYPWARREMFHGLLHVQSVPFVLGRGDLTFESNGGDHTVPQMPHSTLDMARNGEGVLGVALTEVHSGKRVLTKNVRSRRFWYTEKWNATLLEPFYGEKFVLDIFDYRGGDWAWLAVDSFVIPTAWVQITSVEPVGGPRAGGTVVTIRGKNFGSTAEGVTVFIGENECMNVGITRQGFITCITPPGDGYGVTVSVVIGNYERNLRFGPFGGHQAGHCGHESTLFPFSDCSVGSAPQETKMPRRGFTYRDAPTFVSDPPVLVQEKVQYVYTVQALDPDNDTLAYTAVMLPKWLQFDPETQVLQGTPLRGDVLCRDSNWHPASERCELGGSHRVIVEVTDYMFTSQQDFVIQVEFAPSPLLPIDKSFHFPTREQFLEIQKAAQAENYQKHIPTALSARRIGDSFDFIQGLPGRDPVENSLRVLMQGALRETRINAATVVTLVEGAEAAGYSHALQDLIQQVRMKLAFQEEREQRERAGSLAIFGRDYYGWYQQLLDLINSDVQGARISFLESPDVPYSVPSTGIVDAGLPDEPLHVLRHSQDTLVFVLPVPCNADPDARGVQRNWVSCSFEQYRESYELTVIIRAGSLHLEAAALQPSDVPYTDIVQLAVGTNDLVLLVQGLRARVACYSKRKEELSLLDPRFEAMWTLSSSVLTIRAMEDRPMVVAIDIHHSFPWPTPPSRHATRMKVVRADGIAYHQAAALESLSVEMEEGLGVPADGSLDARLKLLETRIEHYRRRCINDCNNNGKCDTEQDPPVCLCHPGFTNSDCSHTVCPNDCSGRGACDSQQVCTHSDDTGEDDCVGGTGQCSCYAPFFGDDCSLRPCVFRYLTLDDINYTQGADFFRDYFEMNYGKVVQVLISPTDGTPPPTGTIEGDSLFFSNTAVGYVQFERSIDAEAARADLYRDAVPSRGVAHEAVLFPDQMRDFEIRNRQLLGVFGIDAVDCSGRGACDYYAGECYCDVAFFGPGCEFTYCKNDCSGHGKCDYISGLCDCDQHYERDLVLGCRLHSLALTSTLCEDEALDRTMTEEGFRSSPLHLGCYLGVALGSATTRGYCPSLQGLPGGADVPACYTSIEHGSACADCSGYTVRNITQLHTYLDEVCKSLDIYEYRQPGVDCNEEHDHRSVVRGIGALPQTSITFHLELLRAQGVEFSTFLAQAGIVRQFGGRLLDGGCGRCIDDESRCGAHFTVLLDGVVAYAGIVRNTAEIQLDVKQATNLTLVTDTYTPANWYHTPWNIYGGGDAPAIGTEPTEAVWCDGAGWIGARLA